jgi:hypothetical protein
MKIKWILLPMMLLAIGCGVPTVTVLHHDEDKAAEEAEKFAQVAFVQHDPQAAYTVFSEEMKKEITFAIMADTLKKLHPTGYPTHVSATEFEPMPGQPAMNIFLRGKRDNEDFYYRLVMKGTVDTGYRVAGFFRGNGPPPASKLRQPLIRKAPSTQSAR